MLSRINSNSSKLLHQPDSVRNNNVEEIQNEKATAFGSKQSSIFMIGNARDSAHNSTKSLNTRVNFNSEFKSTPRNAQQPLENIKIFNHPVAVVTPKNINKLSSENLHNPRSIFSGEAQIFK